MSPPAPHSGPGGTCHPDVSRGSAGIPVAAPLTLDMVSCQCIRDSLSSPAATCREETKGVCGEMGLSWPLLGHRCCPHRVLWPTQLLVSPSIPQGNPTPQELRANPARAGCTPGTLLSQTQGGRRIQLSWSLPLLPALESKAALHRPPTLRACQEPIAAATAGNVVLQGTCFFTSCCSSSKSSGPREAPAMGP